MKNFPICLGRFLEQNYRPAKLSYTFSSKWRKNSGELKIFSPKAQGSRMPLVRAVYRDLLRRVDACSNQGRNNGGQGAQLPVRRITMRAPKSPNNVTSTSVQYICFRKTSGFKMGALSLLLAPGAI